MALGSFLTHAVGALAGTAYDYLTPGTGQNRLTQSNYNYFAPSPTEKVSAPKSYQPTPTATPAFDTSAYDKQIAASQALIQQYAAALNAQPKLPYYNTSAAWASAQKAAQGVVDPVYQDKLTQYLQKEQLGVKQQTEGEQATEQDIQTTLQNALQDVATNKQRTTEDLGTKMGDIGTAETNYQTNEGTQFDRARAALLGSVANAGLTTSGLGRGQITTQEADRNVASGQQEQGYDQSRRDLQTAATRTFQDLETTSGRAQSTATTNTAQSKKALQDYIDTAALDEQSFRTTNEADRLATLASETGNQYKTQVASFINSLIGSGARSQDIALASQVYGA